MSSSQMFVIGLNKYGDLGISQSDNVQLNILTPCQEQKISKAFSGSEYSIYTDDNYDNIWSAGGNHYGSCGIGYKIQFLWKPTPIT